MKFEDLSHEQFDAISRMIIDILKKHYIFDRYSNIYSNTNDALDNIISFIHDFSYDELQIKLTVNGVIVDSDERTFCIDLAKILRKQNIPNKTVMQYFVRIMLVKLIDDEADRSTLRMFRKCQLNDLVKFVERYNISRKHK